MARIRFDRFGWFSAIAALAGVASAGNIMIGDHTNDRVVRVDEFTGSYRGVLAAGGGLNNPMGFGYGPDNYLYVASSGSHEIKRYNDSGVFVDNYAAINSPQGIVFYDNDLVVASNGGIVRRFGLNGWTLTNPNREYRSLTIYNNRLFVAYKTMYNGGIEEISPVSGASLGDVVGGAAGLQNVSGFVWGRDGRLFVATGVTNTIHVFSATGDFQGLISTPNGPVKMVRFTGSGDLLSTNTLSPAIARYSPSRNTYLNNLYAGSQCPSPYYMERLNPMIECRLWPEGTAPAGMPTTVRVEMSRAGTGVSIQSRTVTVAANGRFDLTTPQFLGEYDLTVKAGTHLRRTIRIDSRDMYRAYANFDLKNGDADGNDTVDAGDYIFVNSKLGLTPASTGWDAKADINSDGVVNSADLNLVITNFTKRGEG